MTISRMDMERQLRAGGGIMTLDEPRQGYFLGKLVKKAGRAIKKVVKSPIGKLALLGAGVYGLGGGFGGSGFSKALLKSRALSPFGSFITKGPQTGKFDFSGILAPLVSKGGKFDLGRTALTGLGTAGILAPFLMSGGDEEDMTGTSYTMPQPGVEEIRNQAREFYRDPTNASLYFMPPKASVQRSFYDFADGGLADIPREGYAEGGIMDLGGMEKDYRTGGFVELGAEERADDVPARLSKNEFVFTADAVRNAGGGDIDKGAEVMQNMMDNLEAGGTISEESQGMNPAQEMFNQAQMLESRIA